MINEEKVLNFDNYFEYRKGSAKFGELIRRIMEWLRIHKDDNTIKIDYELDKFLNDTNIDIEILEDFIKNKNGLINFDIIVSDNNITFDRLNNNDKTRPWIESIQYI